MAKHILCVDDSVTMQKVAEITFDASEFSFHGARNADEGLAAARANKPDLILADAVMPGKTGYDLCSAIKGDPALASVPVLIMCGNSQAYDSARGEGVGADGHVVKPWDTQVMLDKVAEILENGATAQPATPKPIAAASSAPLAAPPKPPPSAPPVAARPPATPPATPPAVAKPAMPSFSQPEPPRSATIMGMPSLKLPGEPTADFGAAEPIAAKPKAPAPPSMSPPPLAPPVLKPTPPPTAPAMPQRLEPLKPATPTPAPPTMVKPPSPPAPMTRPPAPVAARPAIPEMPRPPMIKGTPSRRPASITSLDSGMVSMESSGPVAMPAPMAPPPPNIEPARPPILARASAAATEVATAAGIDPNSPEMAAITKLSRDVVERIVWEVVPELAEAIIREHIAKNGIN